MRTKEKTEKKKKKKDWIDYLLTFIIIASTGAAIYFAYNPIKDYAVAKNNENKTQKAAEQVVKGTDYPDVASLKANENQGIVGWIRIPGTNIDEPIVQGHDNEHYLTYSWNNTYDELGSIFLDVKANSNFTDDLSFLFGHTTYLDNKFTQLVKFKDPTFREQTKEFYFFTDTNDKITYEVIGIGTIEPTNPLYTENELKIDKDNLENYKNELKNWTDISDEELAEIDENSRLTLLVTCLSPVDSSGRQIVLAKEVLREAY